MRPGADSPLDPNAPGLPDDAVIVIFGGSGDLTRRKLLPALDRLRQEGLTPARFAVLGVGRTPLDDVSFRERSDLPDETRQHLFYCQADYTPEGASIVGARVQELAEARGIPCNILFYLAVPPDAFLPIITSLSSVGLAQQRCGTRGWVRVVIEKPFGRDLESARSLNRSILPHLSESQIYRIDHYLGKEGVQNLLVFRFANSIFEPIWNSRFIDHIQILSSETLGVEGRGGYYEHAGLLRDMVQNHLMQMLCLTCMEPPASLSPDDIRNEKVKVLKALRPLQLDGERNDAVRGQYAAGTVEGHHVPGYREEPDVVETSNTETFAALRVFIDNYRWAGVPIYIHAGKRLSRRGTEIVVVFRETPKVLFASIPGISIPRNRLVFRIQPHEGIILDLGTKIPGQKMRIKRTTMDFAYTQAFETPPPEAYERLLLDAMRGDPTLFVRSDENELSWSFLQPLIDRWASVSGRNKIPLYAAGSRGPTAADDLIRADGREWALLDEEED